LARRRTQTFQVLKTWKVSPGEKSNPPSSAYISALVSDQFRLFLLLCRGEKPHVFLAVGVWPGQASRTGFKNLEGLARREVEPASRAKPARGKKYFYQQGLRFSEIVVNFIFDMKNYYPEMQPSQFYHVFNRGNNREDIFYKPENAAYFLYKYSKYLSPLVDTYTYNLLPNHFHILLRVKSLEEMLGQAANADFPGFKNLESLARREAEPAVNAYISALVSEQFRLFFMSYAKAINKQEGRVGSLFQKNFKRLAVEGKQHCMNLVLYLHANAQLHDLCDDFRDWTDSSYLSILANGPSKLRRAEVLDWFGGKEQFVKAHDDYIGWKTAGDWWIED